ncbi:MAG: hypothetical protein RLP44_31030 [Aggregatilineales bacterium]
MVGIIIALVALLMLRPFQKEDVDTSNMTIDEVSSYGFYAYILPDEIIESRGWTQTISMVSLDSHCRQIDTIYRENPIWIAYQDGTSRAPFFIAIAPTYSHSYNGNWTSETSEVEASFDPHLGVEYYIGDSGHLALKFVDDIGMQVVVNAWQDKLSVDEVMILISQLEYAGSNRDTLGNPWDNVCE